MIAEQDRYQGIVLRQLLLAAERSLNIGVANKSGRVDAYSIGNAAFQIKHSSKRLSPWTFTYIKEHFDELHILREEYESVWCFLVCGQDGVLGISLHELLSTAQLSESGTAWLRVNRNRSEMYRVSGALGTISRAIPRGVYSFLEEVDRIARKVSA